MSRPKPEVFLSWIDRETYKADEICSCEGLFAVVMRRGGKMVPFNYRVRNSLTDDQPVKYKRTLFNNSGHAFNLAERLNAKFKTDCFCVLELDGGRIVRERK